MTATDLLEPTGPQRPLRQHGQPTVYRPAPDATPRRVRRQPDGTLIGEVPLVADEPTQPNRSMRKARTGDPGTYPPRSYPSRAVLDLDGYDQRPDPLRASTPQEFVAAMRRYREWAGSPSFREMQHFCGDACAASTFYNALRQERLPKLVLLGAFITACGGDEHEYRRWATAWRSLRL